MTSGVSVRVARPSDSTALAELRLTSKQEDKPATLPDADFATQVELWFHQRLSAGSWLGWVAEFDGKIVGNILVCLVDRVPSPAGDCAPLGYVTNFYVEPASRGRGVGASLLVAVTETARREKFNTLVVWPSEDSVSIYRRAGFNPPAELLELPIRPLDGV